MYAAIRRYRVTPEASSRVISRIVGDFVPLLEEKIEEFQACYVLDAGDGVFATVTICDNQYGVEECTKMATEWTKQYLVDTIRNREELSGLSVAIEEPLKGVLYEGARRPPTDQFAQEAAKELSHHENEGSEFLSPSEVGQVLGMGRSWVYQHISSGEIPSMRLGHNIKVRRSDLEEYLKNQQYRRPSDQGRSIYSLEKQSAPLSNM
jgi:excisionase family DNA binding protein